MATAFGHVIAGEEVQSRGGASFQDVDPWSREPWAEVALGDAADAERAIAAARSAFDDGPWPRMRFEERGALLHRLADLIEERADELAAADLRDMGKPISELHHRDVPRSAHNLRFFADHARLATADAYPMGPAHHAYTRYAPAGVVAAIAPWNFPLMLETWKVAPALAWGNTVVLKPAEQSPASATILARLAIEAGLPPGVLNVVPGTGPVAGEALVTHPLVRKVAFTGSTPTGERVMALAATGAKRVTLELGGSDPMIVCDDADLQRAASAASMGRFYNCGQACLAIKRVYVFESVADEVIEAIAAKAAKLRVGIGSREGVHLGPLHTERQRERLEDQLARTLAGGGEVLTGGGRPDDPELAHGWFHEPTVVVEPPRDSPMATEEVFGPVLPIWRVKDLDEALALANDSPFGLGSSIWTSDLRRAERAAAELECGYTWINSPTKVYDELPFGGVKSSGFGKEHGSEALDHYTDLKAVVVSLG
jgi:acyl-CoA reductase-like NAD-dependent aldehyde dehydrogenase